MLPDEKITSDESTVIKHTDTDESGADGVDNRENNKDSKDDDKKEDSSGTQNEMAQSEMTPGQPTDNEATGGKAIRLSGIGFDIEKQIEYKDLVNLTADDLGILRNAFFAKHGYIFKNKKYTEYFSGFDWYAPEAEDVSGRLTDEDKRSVALIQKIENRFFGNNIQLSDEEREMIGMWMEGAVMAAGYSNIYRFYNNGVYKYTESQMNCAERERTHAGKWFMLDGKLYLRTEKRGALVGGELIECEIHGPEVDGADYVVTALDTYEWAVYDIAFDSPLIQKDYIPEALVIGSSDYYRHSADPDEIYEGYEI